MGRDLYDDGSKNGRLYDPFSGSDSFDSGEDLISRLRHDDLSGETIDTDAFDELENGSEPDDVYNSVADVIDNLGGSKVEEKGFMRARAPNGFLEVYNLGDNIRMIYEGSRTGLNESRERLGQVTVEDGILRAENEETCDVGIEDLSDPERAYDIEINDTFDAIELTRGFMRSGSGGEEYKDQNGLSEGYEDRFDSL